MSHTVPSANPSYCFFSQGAEGAEVSGVSWDAGRGSRRDPLVKSPNAPRSAADVVWTARSAARISKNQQQRKSMSCLVDVHCTGKLASIDRNTFQHHVGTDRKAFHIKLIKRKDDQLVTFLSISWDSVLIRLVPNRLWDELAILIRIDLVSRDLR